LFDTAQLTTDLQSAATTPNFSWIAADDYYDGEASGDGFATSISTQDTWLKQTLGPILNSPAWTQQRSLIILTWDESASSGTNHIATVLVGSQGLIQPGVTSSISYNHFSTGRTIENALGLPSLTANDQYAQPINDAFGASTTPTTPTTSTLSISTSSGSNIVFNYSTPAATLSSTNWVGIYSNGQTPGQFGSTSWQYTANASGTVSFSGLASGKYTAYYLYNNGYTVLSTPVNFSVP
jgi:hypothetical protein